MKHKKICFVIESMQGGGAQKNLSYLINSIAKNKISNISLLTFSSSKKDIFNFGKHIKRKKLPLKIHSESFSKKISNNLYRIKLLRKFFLKEDFDIIVSFITTTNILTAISTLGLNVKVIISERNDLQRQKINFFWKILRVFFYKYCDKLILNSRCSYESSLKLFSKNKVRLIPNFVNIEKKKTRKRKRKFFLAVGRLHKQKGFDNLIEAYSIFFKDNKEYDLIILGEGEERTNLENKISQLNLNNKVFLPGYLNPHPYYNSCSLFISSSLYEGVSNATLEAMHYKIPIIATYSQPGIFDYLKNNHSALFANTSPKSLSAKIREIISSRKLAKKISLNAFHSIKKVDNKKIEALWVKEIFNF